MLSKENIKDEALRSLTFSFCINASHIRHAKRIYRISQSRNQLNARKMAVCALVSTTACCFSCPHISQAQNGYKLSPSLCHFCIHTIQYYNTNIVHSPKPIIPFSFLILPCRPERKAVAAKRLR